MGGLYTQSFVQTVGKSQAPITGDEPLLLKVDVEQGNVVGIGYTT